MRKRKPVAVAIAEPNADFLGLRPLTEADLALYPAVAAKKKFTEAVSESLRQIALKIRNRSNHDHKQVDRLREDLRYRLIVEHGKPEGHAWFDVHVSFVEDPKKPNGPPLVIVT